MLSSGKIMSSYHTFISEGSYSGWVEWGTTEKRE